MSPGIKVLFLYAGFYASGVVFIKLAIDIDPLFFIPLLLIMFATGIMCMLIRCPHCGHRVMAVKAGFAGMPLAVRGWPPKQRPGCGRRI